MPPLMIQTAFITKLRSMYTGDDITSILPMNIKKCRQKSIFNQLPKVSKHRYEMKGHLKEASTILHKYFKPTNAELEENAE